MPKDPRVVIFGASGGRAFADNARYLFEHCARNGRLDVYWFCRDENLAQGLRLRHGARVLAPRSLQGLLRFLRAKALVISHGAGDVAPFPIVTRRKLVVNVWHGMPLKTIGFLDPTDDPIRMRREYSRYSHLVAASAFEGDILARCFGMPRERIWITGRPRNDALFAPDADLRERLPGPREARLVLYAPTWRERGAVADFFPFPDLDPDALTALLERHDSYLLLRNHINEGRNAHPEAGPGSPRVVNIGPDKLPDVSDLLPFVDVLVTDYSSIYVDFLLLDRPIVFAPYDYEEYRAARGFTMEYDQHTPGPKVRSGRALLEALDRYLTDATVDAARRRAARDLFHRFPDGHACSRTEALLCATLALDANDPRLREGDARRGAIAVSRLSGRGRETKPPTGAFGSRGAE